VHGVAGSSSASIVPATHDVHSVEPQPAKLPAKHASQGVDALVSVSAAPAVQKTHEAEPGPAYWPAAQFAQAAMLVPPAVGANVPAAHDEHADGPTVSL